MNRDFHASVVVAAERDLFERADGVKPHTTKVACFLMPPCGGYLLEVSDCLSTDTV